MKHKPPKTLLPKNFFSFAKACLCLDSIIKNKIFFVYYKPSTCVVQVQRNRLFRLRCNTVGSTFCVSPSKRWGMQNIAISSNFYSTGFWFFIEVWSWWNVFSAHHTRQRGAKSSCIGIQVIYILDWWYLSIDVLSETERLPEGTKGPSRLCFSFTRRGPSVVSFRPLMDLALLFLLWVMWVCSSIKYVFIWSIGEWSRSDANGGLSS